MECVVGSFVRFDENFLSATVRCFQQKNLVFFAVFFFNKLLQKCEHKSQALPLEFLSKCRHQPRAARLTIAEANEGAFCGLCVTLRLPSLGIQSASRKHSSERTLFEH